MLAKTKLILISMRKFIFSLLLIFGFSVSALAQIDSTQTIDRLESLELETQELRLLYEATQDEIRELERNNETLQTEMDSLSAAFLRFPVQIDSLRALLSENRGAVNSLERRLIRQRDNLQDEISGANERTDSLNADIIQLEERLAERRQELQAEISEARTAASQNYTELDEALSSSTLYWIIAVLGVGFLSLVAFVFLRKQVSDNQTSITESLSNTRKELEQEAIRLDEKLIGVMETQMKIIQEERKAQPETAETEPDHSLALKVADEIVRIEKNISRMDESTKGLKQLSKAVGRIKSNFASNGYEMVDMVGKAYDDGMKITANFRPDESLETGQKIITRIIKPQVNYKGEMIQSAQVEVSQGE